MEGPKLDDLTPKWMQGSYVGRSESLCKGHLVHIKDDGERFVHTLHVRSALHDPGPVEEKLVSEEPAGPSKRLRGKSSGSGDIVAVSKATVFDEVAYQARAEAVLEQWSQEEAEAIVTEIAWMHGKHLRYVPAWGKNWDNTSYNRETVVCEDPSEAHAGQGPGCGVRRDLCLSQ